jgi:ParB-like nuclease domain/MT-A70
VSEIKLSAIKVGKRHRRTLGDIDQLAASIEEIGLLQPIGITRDKKLIFGERRLEAYKRLGRSTIPCQVVDLPRILDGEVAENNMRKAFTLTERVAIAASVAASLGDRQGQRTDLLRQNFAQVIDADKGKTRHIAAQKAGLGSGETLRKAQLIIEAATENPDQYGDLPEKMDNTGKVQGAYCELLARRDRERVAGLVPRPGRFRSLIVDCPWHHEYPDSASRGAASYATMTFDQLRELPIADYAEDDCHLWLWTTNGHLANAINLIAHWGFTYRVS